MEPEIDRLLFCDAEGRTIGLDKVQLMEPPLLVRVPRLRALLTGDDVYVTYLAARVLAAWGDGEGMAAIERMFDERVHRRGSLSPHRLYDYENCYDWLAEAAELYATAGGDRRRTIDVYRRALALYGDQRFECRLKEALMQLREEDGLIGDVEAAIRRSLARGRVYLASQLLPVIASWRADAFWDWLPSFEEAPADLLPNPLCNVAEGLGIVGTTRGKERLEAMRAHPDSGVRFEVEEALGRFG